MSLMIIYSKVSKERERERIGNFLLMGLNFIDRPFLIINISFFIH